MSAFVDFPHSVLSNYYDFGDHDAEALPTSKTLSTWQGFRGTSNSSHLPSRLHDEYEYLRENYLVSENRFLAGRDAIWPWTEAQMCDATPSAFIPRSENACQHHMEMQNLGDDDNHWDAQKYRSQLVDYPTPQSDLSLSPPQQTQQLFGSRDLIYTGGHEQFGAAPGSNISQRLFGDISSYERPSRQQPRVLSPREAKSPFEQEDRWRQPNEESEDSDEDGSVNCEPYAQLIFRALKGAPGYKMVLKDIYRWFEKNTDKASKSSRGWQNSIRHNLSMNGAFKKVDHDPSTDEAKKGFIWVLEPSALVDGVKSTTRYRKAGSNKKSGKGRHPAPERQRSGAKGGKAARKVARLRRSARCEGSRPRGREDMPLQHVELPALNITSQPPTPSSMWTPGGVETFFSAASRSSTPLPTQQTIYDFGDIDGVTSIVPNGPLFPEDRGPSCVNDPTTFHSLTADDPMSSDLGPTVHRVEL